MYTRDSSHLHTINRYVQNFKSQQSNTFYTKKVKRCRLHESISIALLYLINSLIKQLKYNKIKCKKGFYLSQ